MDELQLYAELAKRVDKCESCIQDLQRQDNTLSIQQAKMDTKLDNISTILIELKAEIKILADKPAKRWDSLVNYIISALVSIIVSGGAIAAVFKYYAHSGG